MCLCTACLRVERVHMCVYVHLHECTVYVFISCCNQSGHTICILFCKPFIHFFLTVGLSHSLFSVFIAHKLLSSFFLLTLSLSPTPSFPFLLPPSSPGHSPHFFSCSLPPFPVPSYPCYSSLSHSSPLPHHAYATQHHGEMCHIQAPREYVIGI